jgi:hypothetical protein
MFLEEKLDRLQSYLSPDDLVIRFTEFKSIMSKIEAKFLSSEDLNYHYNGWIVRLKDFEDFAYEQSTFDYLEGMLDKDKKYWWIYVNGPEPNSRHYVFDATLKGGRSLSYVFPRGVMYIVHKKYDWMFLLNREEKTGKRRILKNE